MKKANNLVTGHAAHRDPSLWPFIFQISSESVAGNQICPVFKHWQADLMWSECCNIIISQDITQCAHNGISSICKLRSLAAKPRETGEHFGWFYSIDTIAWEVFLSPPTPCAHQFSLVLHTNLLLRGNIYLLYLAQWGRDFQFLQ